MHNFCCCCCFNFADYCYSSDETDGHPLRSRTEKLLRPACIHAARSITRWLLRGEDNAATTIGNMNICRWCDSISAAGPFIHAHHSLTFSNTTTTRSWSPLKCEASLIHREKLFRSTAISGSSPSKPFNSVITLLIYQHVYWFK